MTDPIEGTGAVAAAASTTDVVAVTASTDPARADRKVREGYVVSDKMDKTVVVALQDRKRHPRYAKIMRSTTKVKVHDEANVAGVGDRVLLMETRPLSATKRWRLVQVLEKAK